MSGETEKIAQGGEAGAVTQTVHRVQGHSSRHPPVDYGTYTSQIREVCDTFFCLFN